MGQRIVPRVIVTSNKRNLDNHHPKESKQRPTNKSATPRMTQMLQATAFGKVHILEARKGGIGGQVWEHIIHM